ncbi:hypothetical protein CDAR_429341 [Caerostris darwini]|uniref:Uncharacterized protein n=1 Tax=Caerostris darwini TaxID=1538125 RepID=A0AAV4QIG6_9ARAC|nr:hypothetical protein CDAR_429341 [Caerostris darwini]
MNSSSKEGTPHILSILQPPSLCWTNGIPEVNKIKNAAKETKKGERKKKKGILQFIPFDSPSATSGEMEKRCDLSKQRGTEQLLPIAAYRHFSSSTHQCTERDLSYLCQR